MGRVPSVLDAADPAPLAYPPPDAHLRAPPPRALRPHAPRGLDPDLRADAAPPRRHRRDPRLPERLGVERDPAEADPADPAGARAGPPRRGPVPGLDGRRAARRLRPVLHAAPAGERHSPRARPA